VRPTPATEVAGISVFVATNRSDAFSDRRECTWLRLASEKMVEDGYNEEDKYNDDEEFARTQNSERAEEIAENRFMKKSKEVPLRIYPDGFEVKLRHYILEIVIFCAALYAILLIFVHFVAEAKVDLPSIILLVLSIAMYVGQKYAIATGIAKKGAKIGRCYIELDSEHLDKKHGKIKLAYYPFADRKGSVFRRLPMLFAALPDEKGLQKIFGSGEKGEYVSLHQAVWHDLFKLEIKLHLDQEDFLAALEELKERDEAAKNSKKTEDIRISLPKTVAVLVLVVALAYMWLSGPPLSRFAQGTLFLIAAIFAALLVLNLISKFNGGVSKRK